MHYTWGWTLHLSWGVLQPGSPLTSCSRMQPRAPVGYEQSSAEQCPRASLTFLGHQLQHNTSGKNLLWGHRTIAANCCHCVLAAEFVLHPGWGDSEDATALAVLRPLHHLRVNGKKEESAGRRDVSLCCIASHWGRVNEIVILEAYRRSRWT